MHLPGWSDEALDALIASAASSTPDLALARLYSSVHDIILMQPTIIEEPETDSVLDVRIGGADGSGTLSLDIPVFLQGPGLPVPEAAASSAAEVFASKGLAACGLPSQDEQVMPRTISPWLPDRSGPGISGLQASGMLEVQTIQYPRGGGQPLRHLGLEDYDALARHVSLLKEATSYERPVIVRITGADIQGELVGAAGAGADAAHLYDHGQYPPGSGFWGPPNFHALARAARGLKEAREINPKFKLLCSGDFRSSTDVTVALAFGADAVGLGVAPWVILGADPELDEDGNILAWHDPLDPGKATLALENYIDTLGSELRSIMSTLGRTTPDQLSTDDMRATSHDLAAITGLKLAGFDRELAMWFH